MGEISVFGVHTRSYRSYLIITLWFLSRLSIFNVTRRWMKSSWAALVAEYSWVGFHTLTVWDVVVGASPPEPEGAADPQSGAPKEGGRAAEGGLLPLPVLFWTFLLPHTRHRNSTAHSCLTHTYTFMRFCPDCLPLTHSHLTVFLRLIPTNIVKDDVNNLTEASSRDSYFYMNNFEQLNNFQ